MDAGRFLRQELVIDLHNDTIVAHQRLGNASLAQPGLHYGDDRNGSVAGPYGHLRPATGGERLQLDLVRMAEAGLDAGLFAVDVTLACNHHLSYALDALGYLLNDLDRSEQGDLVRKPGDIERLWAEGRRGVLMHVENADVTDKSLNVLRALYALGVRSLGLTHNVSSCAADGCMEARQGTGLTHFGKRLVREMNRLGMVVDLAHVSPRAFYEALEVSDRPVLFSHGNAQALCDHPRNLSDHQLRALAQQGGVIGLSWVPSFVDPERATLSRLLDHFDHVVATAGITSVALGSDMDGGGTLLPDVFGLGDLVGGLSDRGWDEEALRLVLGGNALRVLERALVPQV